MNEQKRFYSYRNLWLYGFFAVLMLSILVWTSLRAIRETPVREVSVQIEDLGWVTFSLTTDPFPPLPTGLVRIDLRILDRRGMDLDWSYSLPYSFGPVGSELAIGSGVTIQGSLSYSALLTFPSVGAYWLQFDLENGDIVRFQIYVEPAQ